VHHKCLNYGHTTVLQRWHLTRDGVPWSAPINATLCSNNGDVLRAASIAGLGIAILPTFLVGPDIASGRLSIVLGEFPPKALGIYALYAPNRYLAAKTRVLVDFLAARFGKAPEWDHFARAGT
jgi:DNA-binding transcriptional LysR family regulator